MNRWSNFLVVMFGLLVIATACALAADIRSAGNARGTPIKSSWSKDSTWEGNVVPGPGDNVTISNGDTVIIDVPVNVNDITVGDGASGGLIFVSNTAVTVTVTGSLTVSPGAIFRCTGSDNPVTHDANLDTLFIYGDFIINGNVDLRTGSGPLYGVCCVYFTGSSNSLFKSHGGYTTSTNEFNAISINKSGGAKVTLGSDIYMAGGSSSYPNSQPYLDLINGVIDSKTFCIVNFSTASNDANIIKPGSKTSYVSGCVGRGMSSGSTTTRIFPIGDKDGFRPIKVHNSTAGNATGNYIRVKAVRGNANPSNSPLPAEIDKISTARYYRISYDTALATSGGTPSFTMSIDKFNPSYGAQDGIVAGSPNLRVAYTTDSLINWKAMGQVHKDTTEFTDPPAYWTVDSIPQANWISLSARGKGAFVAFARAAGTTENSLDFTPLGVRDEVAMPLAINLAQNFPNPFNPTTTIQYTINHTGWVSLEVVNVLGQRVAQLAEGVQEAGGHTVYFNASNLTSGVYYYRIAAGSVVMTKSMMLVK